MIARLARLEQRRHALRLQADEQRRQARALLQQGREATAPTQLAGQVLGRLGRHPGAIVAVVGLLVALGPGRRRALARAASAGLAGLLARRL
ncbi:MAG: hypothetical protein R3E68_05245 [Burkholderiaceae bacterium]